MRNRLIGSIAVAALALAACGGDDDDASGQQGEVADMMIEVLEGLVGDEGMDMIDQDCIREKAGELSDDDAAAIVEAGVDGDPEVSAEAEAIADSMQECVDLEALGG